MALVRLEGIPQNNPINHLSHALRWRNLKVNCSVLEHNSFRELVALVHIYAEGLELAVEGADELLRVAAGHAAIERVAAGRDA